MSVTAASQPLPDPPSRAEGLAVGLPARPVPFFRETRPRRKLRFSFPEPGRRTRSLFDWTLLPGWSLSLAAHVLILLLLGSTFQSCAAARSGPAGEFQGFELSIGDNSSNATTLRISGGGADHGKGHALAGEGDPLSIDPPAPPEEGRGGGEPGGGGGGATGLDKTPPVALPTVASGTGAMKPGGTFGLGLGPPGFGKGLGFGGDARNPIRSNGIQGPAGAAGAGLGMGRAEFFGIPDKATRIVYVLDCSGSMTNYNAIRVAKAELISSLEGLDKNTQFQVIFYNQAPKELALSNSRGSELYYATDVNRQLAKQFIDGIQADLGTDHIPALKKALRYNPEVIYFLTDADEPQLTARELSELEKTNNGRSRIHCIEFGKGPELKLDNFLKRLSQQNGGRYRYQDVTRFDKE